MADELTLDKVLDIGFEHAIFFDPENLEFRQEVRDMCSADKCHHYNRCWSCPPACGSVEESVKKAQKYTQAVMIQTTAVMEDSFDFEGIAELGQRHGRNFAELYARLRQDYPGMLPLSNTGCSVCKKCTYPDEPCRFPDKQVYSMSAYGLFVSRVCKDNGLEYNHGKDTMTYSSCYLLE